ncbi:MAG: M43 family zinc metalloprotease [Chitinophagales bacterium]
MNCSKNIQILLILLSLPVIAFAQNEAIQKTAAYCAFDQVTLQNERFQDFNERVESQVEILEANWNEAQKDNHIKTVPVVVHVIHDGGTENISMEQIESQMEVLTNTFRKVSGTNGDADGVDTEIQFALARKNPQGRCTNGVVRVQSPLTMHQNSERHLLAQLSRWDARHYLNIYVVRRIGTGNTLGYAAFPGGPLESDGIVVAHNVFGTMGTAGGNTTGRTTVHEIGHWLGLFHPFQDEGCGDDVCTSGDRVCDTPPQTQAFFGCPQNSNSCHNDNPDRNDPIRNYMNYTDDACQDEFTYGQKLRMHAALILERPGTWSPTNLTNTGINDDNPPETCGIAADFVTLTPKICVGNGVQFHDRSLNEVTTWQWIFTGGTPATSVEVNPIVTYNTTGTYKVGLAVFDADNQVDYFEIDNYIEVEEPGMGRALAFGEDFETGDFSDEIQILNPDNEITWEVSDTAAYEGTYSIKINNLINTNYGQLDEIILPFFDLTSTTENPFLRFYWAYAPSHNIFSDEMVVSISTDCGSTFETLRYLSGNSLSTAPLQTTPFLPTANQWEMANISLSAYKDESYILIKITNVTDGGNNLYLDEIYVGDGSLPTSIEDAELKAAITVFPNPSNGFLQVQLPVSASKNVSLTVTDIHGKMVLKQDFEAIEVLQLDTRDFSKGLYLLKVEMDGNVGVEKFLVE